MRHHSYRWILMLVVMLVAIVYLNRAYARMYQYITDHYQPQPTTQSVYRIIGSPIRQTIFTYVALGDSLTAGVGAKTAEETFPYHFAEQLAEQSAEVTYYNFGVPGAKSSDVVASQLGQAVSKNPDYVTLLIGVNDMHGFISKSKFSNNIRTIIATLLTKTHAKIVVINLPFIGSPTLLWPPYQWFFDMRTRSYNATLKKMVPNDPRVKFIDLYSATHQSFMADSPLYAADAFHPSAQGYAFWNSVIHAN